jgi:sortase A
MGPSRLKRSKTVRPLAEVPCTSAFFSHAPQRLLVLFALAGLLASLQAAWIPLKAELAQFLLQRSWTQQQAGRDLKPWPWADTHAVALLEVPRLSVQQIVLEGSSGRNLAFGPTLSGTSLELGDWVINGHRDTHFDFLHELQSGDHLSVKTYKGAQVFRVETLEVIDSREFELVLEPGVTRLSLVTCFPFDAASAGGPLRYVVTALPLEKTGAISPAVSSG